MNSGPVISYGWNRKAMRVPIWNIPAGPTCPGATAAGCRAGCYAMKAERQYPAARAARQRNLEWTKRPDFVPVMADQIEQLRRRRLFEFFRIHEAGDFYRADYFRSWALICAATPHVTFWAYTKAPVWDLWRPDNLVLLASEYLGNVPAGVPASAPRFVTVAKGGTPPDATRCPSQCDDCGYQCAKVAPGAVIWTPFH